MKERVKNMKLPIWLTTTVIAWGILIPTKAQSQVTLNLAEPSNISEQKTEVYTLAKKRFFKRKFNRHRGHGGHRGHRRGRFNRSRGHFPHGRSRRGHFNRRNHGRNHGRHRGSSGIFIRF